MFRDYIHGTALMADAWPSGTEVNKWGDKVHTIPLGNPNFVHATEWVDAEGRTVTAADDPLYRALGIIRVASVGLVVISIAILIGAAV